MPDREGRISELERRVERDPASPAFAALAEEYRKAGRLDEAVKTCRDGLQHLPGYLTAKVTLARALAELDQVEAARDQLAEVLAEAPGNLPAMQAVYEIQRKMAMGTGHDETGTSGRTDDPNSTPLDSLASLPPLQDGATLDAVSDLEAALLAAIDTPVIGNEDDHADPGDHADQGGEPVEPEGEPSENDPRVVQGLENLLNAILMLRGRSRSDGQDPS